MKYMKYNKGFAPLAILLIVLGIAAIGGIAYYVGKSSKSELIQPSDYSPTTEQLNTPPVQTPSSPSNPPVLDNQAPQQTNKTISLANWKTYTNTECGYSFQYPASWSLWGHESNAINLQGNIMSNTVDFMDTASQGIERGDGNNNEIAAAKDHMHVECYTMGTAVYNDDLSRYNNSLDIFAQNKKTITVAGQTAIVGEIKSTATVSSGEHPGRTLIPSHNMYVFFLHKDQTRALYFEFDTPLGSGDAVEIAIFEQLLKTFKFN